MLDMEEFFEAVSSSRVLQKAFRSIMMTAEERRERSEKERLACIFRSPAARQRSRLPLRERGRPSLKDLRPMHEISMPWDATPLAPVPFSPQALASSKTKSKSQLVHCR